MDRDAGRALVAALAGCGPAPYTSTRIRRSAVQVARGDNSRGNFHEANIEDLLAWRLSLFTLFQPIFELCESPVI